MTSYNDVVVYFKLPIRSGQYHLPVIVLIVFRPFGRN